MGLPSQYRRLFLCPPTPFDGIVWQRTTSVVPPSVYPRQAQIIKNNNLRNNGKNIHYSLGYMSSFVRHLVQRGNNTAYQYRATVDSLWAVQARATRSTVLSVGSAGFSTDIASTTSTTSQAPSHIIQIIVFASSLISFFLFSSSSVRTCGNIATCIWRKRRM